MKTNKVTFLCRKNCKRFLEYCTSVGFANDMAELCPKTCKLCSSLSSSNRGIKITLMLVLFEVILSSLSLLHCCEDQYCTKDRE